MSDDDGAEVLVIDGANVVGSRPDGWWRDRAGAAARLHDQLRDRQRRDRQRGDGPTLAPWVVLVLGRPGSCRRTGDGGRGQWNATGTDGRARCR